MNKAVELINEWAAFDEQYPGTSLEDFCRHYLIKKREPQDAGEISGGVMPPKIDSILLKLLGRITSMGQIYSREMLKKIPEIQLEGFHYLTTLRQLGESRKTDVINHHLSELSTGIDILNRLKESELIEERPDPSDRRAKLIKVSPQGNQLLLRCFWRMSHVGSILFDELAEEDKKLCIQLLKNVEIKHAKLALEVKSRGLDALGELNPDFPKKNNDTR